MKRRLVGLLLLGLLAPLAALAKEPEPRRIGVWLTNSPSPLYYSKQRLNEAVEELSAAGFNTLYPNVWSRGTTFHRSRWAPMEPALLQSAPKLDPICRFTELGEAANRIELGGALE